MVHVLLLDALRADSLSKFDLKNHIDVGQVTPDDAVQTTQEVDQNQQYINNLQQDSQVIQALNILQALSIAN